MDRKGRSALRVGLILTGIVTGAVSAAGAQVMEIGPAGFSVMSGPALLTPEGAASIVNVRRSTGPSDRQAAAAPLLDQAGTAADLSPRLLEAIAYVESRFNNAAISPEGAIGMMQLMPGTAKELGVDARVPEENVRGGADYLRRMLVLFDNNIELAIAAYNAGPGAVLKHGGVPPYPETRTYVAAVMDYLAHASTPEIDG